MNKIVRSFPLGNLHRLKRAPNHLADCDIPRILSVTPALPGWLVAFAQPITREVWFKPIAAWAYVDPGAVLPMVGRRGGSASLEVVTDSPSLIVPPGHRVEWDAQFGWLLEPPRETWPEKLREPNLVSEEW